MTEITVRELGVEDWDAFREMRLTALRESPEAFVASHEAESAEPESFWRERMARSRRLLAERSGEALGIASVGVSQDIEGEDAENAGELFGLWVRPEARGSGVAAALVKAGARSAVGAGHAKLLYWVGTDNGRAVAFASGFGFRPTAARRPMRVVSEDDGEEEIAMVLPLAAGSGFLARGV